VPNVLIWNIDRDYQQFFADELKAGRLRQGWGRDDRLDLRFIQQKLNSGAALDEQEKEAWDRLNGMVRWIHPNDIILVKNTPSWGYYTLAKVVGNYDYDQTPMGDYRHVLPVDTLRVVNKLSAPVSGDLRTSIDRAMWPITPAIKRHEEILDLLNFSAEQLATPVKWHERMDAQSCSLVDFVKKNIIPKLAPKDFEELVKVLLQSRDFENIKVTAGPVENGADIVMSVTAPFFDDLPVVVQTKHHYPVDDDTTSVNQLRRAFEFYRPRPIAGLLVTSAETIGPNLNAAVEKMKTDGNTVAVLHGEQLYRLILGLFETSMLRAY
jgi:hypothetical protein